MRLFRGLTGMVQARVGQRIKPGSFGHKVMVMFLGTALGQFSSVLLSPVLTRIYTPQDFGVLGVFTALLTIMAVIASLRYEMALPLAKTKEDAANMLAVCGLSLLFTTSIGIVILACLSKETMESMHLGVILPYRWLLPVGFFCIGAYQVLVYFATQRDSFGIIARTKIYQGLAGPFTQIGLGLLQLGPWGLILGFVTGQSTGSGLLFSRLVLPKGAMDGLSWASIRMLAKRYIRFPLLSSWAGLVNSVGSSQLVLVVIPILYSSTIAGYIFLTDRIVGRPLLLISTSILQVYLGDVSKSIESDPQAIRKRFLTLAGQQFCIVAVWLLIVNLLAGYFFPILFGQEWAEAVPYLHVLSIAYLPQMVISALAHTLQVLERQGLSAIWEIGRLVAVAGSLGMGYYLGLDALHTLLWYSIAQALSQMLLFVLMYGSIQKLRKKPAHA